ncbi:MAG: RecX family transcriptional regulator [Acidimicrobiales bacterium]|nr:MAG: RecX family transcriptional regulator [Acidimicrobiales bacterium]
MLNELDSDPEAVARLICLQQLEHKPRTRAELAETLRRRGVPDPAATAVLDRLTDVGLIDDAAYAQQWVEQRHRSHGSARRLLAAQLQRKGVDPEQITAAVEQLPVDTQEQTAAALVVRKRPSLARYDMPTQTRRLVALLARKGYSSELSYRVVRQALELEDDP